MNLRQHAHVIMRVSISPPYEYHVINVSPSYYTNESNGNPRSDIFDLKCGATRTVITGQNSLHKFIIDLFKRELPQGYNLYEMVDAAGTTLDTDDLAHLLTFIRLHSNANTEDESLYKFNDDSRGVPQSNVIYVPDNDTIAYIPSYMVKLADLGQAVEVYNFEKDCPDKFFKLYCIYQETVKSITEDMPINVSNSGEGFNASDDNHSVSTNDSSVKRTFLQDDEMSSWNRSQHIIYNRWSWPMLSSSLSDRDMIREVSDFVHYCFQHTRNELRIQYAEVPLWEFTKKFNEEKKPQFRMPTKLVYCDQFTVKYPNASQSPSRLKVKDFSKLQLKSWVNDELMHAFMGILAVDQKFRNPTGKSVFLGSVWTIYKLVYDGRNYDFHQNRRTLTPEARKLIFHSKYDFQKTRRSLRSMLKVDVLGFAPIEDNVFEKYKCCLFPFNLDDWHWCMIIVSKNEQGALEVGLLDSMGPNCGIDKDHFDLLTYAISVFVFQLENDGQKPTDEDIMSLPITFYQLFKCRVQQDNVNCGIIILLICYIVWSKEQIESDFNVRESLTICEFLSAIVKNLLFKKAYGNNGEMELFNKKDYDTFRLYVAICILFNRMYDRNLKSILFDSNVYHEVSEAIGGGSDRAINVDETANNSGNDNATPANTTETCHVCYSDHKIFYTHTNCGNKMCFNCYDQQIRCCKAENKYNGTRDAADQETGHNDSLVPLTARRNLRSSRAYRSMRDISMFKGNVCPMCRGYGLWKCGDVTEKPIYGFAKIMIDLSPYFQEVTVAHRYQSMCYKTECTQQLYTDWELKQIGVEDIDVDLYNQVDE